MKIDTETLTVAVSLLESHTHTINLANIDINDACNNFIGMGEYIEELQRHYKEYEAIILKTINRLKQMSYFINNEVIKQYQNVENELTKKKYGLIWEEHEERVDKELETQIPTFVDVTDKQIKECDNKFNFLLEGDNLHSLYLLEKTHFDLY